jgi:hypothetical protein
MFIDCGAKYSRISRIVGLYERSNVSIQSTVAPSPFYHENQRPTSFSSPGAPVHHAMLKELENIRTCISLYAKTKAVHRAKTMVYQFKECGCIIA